MGKSYGWVLVGYVYRVTIGGIVKDMRGYSIHVSISDKPDNIRFRLYDNGELAVNDIGAMDFQYLTPSGYTGSHTLTMSYFQDFDPTEESALQVIHTQDFTLPDLTYIANAEILL